MAAEKPVTTFIRTSFTVNNPDTCVVFPGYSITQNNDAMKSYTILDDETVITKLIPYGTESQNEEAFDEIVKDADPTKKYYLSSESKLLVDKDRLAKFDLDRVNECTNIMSEQNVKKYQLFNYPFGGLTLFSYLDPRKPYFEDKDSVKLLLGARNIINGLKMLQELDITHADLKPDNIVVGDPGGNLVWKIIDLGAAVYDNTLNYVRFRQHFIQPTELNLYYDTTINKVADDKLEQFCHTSMKKIQDNFTTYGIEDKMASLTKNGSILYSFTEHPVKICDQFKTRPYTTTEKQQMVSKLDVYSLGLCFIYAYNRIFEEKYDMEYLMNEDDEKQLYSNSLQDAFYKLIRHMIQPYHPDRFDIKEVAIFYDNNVLPLLKGMSGGKRRRHKRRKTIKKRNNRKTNKKIGNRTKRIKRTKSKSKKDKK